MNTHLREVAVDSLATFEKIATKASSEKTESRRDGGGGLLTNNTFNGAAADQRLRQIRQEAFANLQLLETEPALARIVLADEMDRRYTYFICRVSPISSGVPGAKLASYKSAVGRLASLPIGADITLNIDRQPTILEVVESARFRPQKSNEGWDSRNTVVEGEQFGPLTIESLRRLIEASTISAPDEDLLERLLAEEGAAENVHQGLRRTVIDRMDLRDQPILDQYQDQIFRLPLGSRLLILGAPGTGKTTTLIRRLGQKINTEFLELDEVAAVENSPFKGDVEHPRSWIMFTPTELLRLYVKEAFNREGIPAPDQRISTWDEFRDDLARNDFGILRSASQGNGFIQKRGSQTIRPEAVRDPIGWFTEFDQFQRRAYWGDLKSAAETIVAAPNTSVAQIGRRLVNAINSGGDTPHPDAFVAFDRISEDISPLVEALGNEIEKPIRLALNTQLATDRSFPEKFSRFLESLDAPTDEADEADVDDDDVAPQSSTGIQAVWGQYSRLVRSLALARYKKRSITRSSRSGRMVEWIGDRVPPSTDLARIGEFLSMQTALRRFVNPVRGYLNGIPRRYRQFRRSAIPVGRWYNFFEISSNEIHPLEVDAILLAMMRAADELVTGSRDLLNGEGPSQTLLRRHIERYRTQVLIDEVTDFSAIQIAIMSLLSRPSTRSVFACGDFNQRVTSWGANSLETLNWAIPNLSTREIAVAYRQSDHLHELARKIVESNGGTTTGVQLAGFSNGAGVAPVLVERIQRGAPTANWLAERIREIDSFVGEMPSIAVLVNSEEDVVPVSEALREALEDQNIKVTACQNGQVRGNDGTVRVFNVEHIKGLEFEAVFFLEVDELQRRQPDLFSKYLYVGATRAATYFGMTCLSSLPENLRDSRRMFIDTWSSRRPT